MLLAGPPAYRLGAILSRVLLHFKCAVAQIGSLLPPTGCGQLRGGKRSEIHVLVRRGIQPSLILKTGESAPAQGRVREQ